jgi:hypothetical protein
MRSRCGLSAKPVGTNRNRTRKPIRVDAFRTVCIAWSCHRRFLVRLRFGSRGIHVSAITIPPVQLCAVLSEEPPARVVTDATPLGVSVLPALYCIWRITHLAQQWIAASVGRVIGVLPSHSIAGNKSVAAHVAAEMLPRSAATPAGGIAVLLCRDPGFAVSKTHVCTSYRRCAVRRPALKPCLNANISRARCIASLTVPSGYQPCFCTHSVAR